ncbi:MAG: hypothetical protein RI897_4514 [Verrucomicrobiota bacterium]
MIVGGQFTEGGEAEVCEGEFGALGEGGEVWGEGLGGLGEVGAVVGGDGFDLGGERVDILGEEEGEHCLGGALWGVEDLLDCWGEGIAPGRGALEELGVELAGGADPGFCGEGWRGMGVVGRELGDGGGFG